MAVVVESSPVARRRQEDWRGFYFLRFTTPLLPSLVIRTCDKYDSSRSEKLDKLQPDEKPKSSSTLVNFKQDCLRRYRWRSISAYLRILEEHLTRAVMLNVAILWQKHFLATLNQAASESIIKAIKSEVDFDSSCRR